MLAASPMTASGLLVPERIVPMSTFTVRQGVRYRATISLGMLQSLASNETIGDKFRALGFTEVAVMGEGETRTAEGVWLLADVTAPLPPEITTVTELEV
jgi:hypothetical protein